MSAEIESKSSVNLELTKLLNEKLSKNIKNISFASSELDELKEKFGQFRIQMILGKSLYLYANAFEKENNFWIVKNS